VIVFNFSKPLYHALGQDNVFQSPTNTQAIELSNRASQLIAELTPYIEEDTVSAPDAVIIQRGIDALGNYQVKVVELEGHIQSRLESLLDDLQVAVAVREIDSYVNDVEPNNDNIDAVAGSVSGVADTILDTVAAVFDQLTLGLTDYTTNQISTAEFEQAVSSAATQINGQVSALQQIMDDELDAAKQLYQRHRQMGHVFAMQSLIQDNSVKPLLKQLAGGQLGEVLTEEFNL
jgi:DNA-binding FrmR family transcriptional regulator